MTDTVVSRWSSSDPADLFTVENPADGTLLATVQGGAAAEVDGAVRAAADAFPDWRRRTPAERGALLLRCADLLEREAEDLAGLVSRENGKPLAQARQADLATLVASFRYFGQLVDKLPTAFHDYGSFYTATVIEPFGVVAGILPFNWPPIHAGAKAAPALAVGNTVVLKPGEQAPLTVMRIVELLSTILPPDVIHVVPGKGTAAGEALARHPLVRKISFTGSTKGGVAVSRIASENVVPVLLELGGKNAFLVFEDADLDAAVRDALAGGFFNKGEACTAASRILVQGGVYDAVVDKLSAGVRALRAGPGGDPATHVGPLVSRAQQRRVLDYLDLARREGARLTAEGSLPADPAFADGFYVRPTLFADVTPAMRIASEEMFGPVVTVTRFDTEEEAVRIANGTDYGLVAGVYTGDMARAFRLSREIEVGTVYINNYNRSQPGTPFGGVKHSGYGREHGIETLHAFGSTKAIKFPSGFGALSGFSISAA